MCDDPLGAPSEVETVDTGEPAAGKKVTPALNKAPFCMATITPPDDTEGNYLTQREFLQALKCNAIPLELVGKN